MSKITYLSAEMAKNQMIILKKAFLERDVFYN